MSKTTRSIRHVLLVRITSLLLAAALLAISLPTPALAAAPAATDVTCSKNHTVESGDTLSKISVTYDVSIADLAAANGLKEPYTLFIGQRICIPGSTTSDTTSSTGSTSKSTTKSWTVVREGKYLVISVENFPKKAIYYVKLKKGHQSSSEPWTKIGLLRTKKNTDTEKAFKLPKSYDDTPLFMVCLKHAYSDAVICQPFRQ